MFIDMKGKRCGRLLVIEHAYTIRANTHTYVMWKCRCDCGNTCYVNGHNLRAGLTRSCGCLRKESAIRNAAACREERLQRFKRMNYYRNKVKY